MAISNELSSEIATAILTAKAESPAQLKELKELVLKIHATLQEMDKGRIPSRRLKPQRTDR